MPPTLLQAPLPAHQAPSTREGQFLRLWSSEARERALHPVEGQAWGLVFPGFFFQRKLFELSPLSLRGNLWDFQSQSTKKLPSHPASEKEKALTD